MHASSLDADVVVYDNCPPPNIIGHHGLPGAYIARLDRNSPTRNVGISHNRGTPTDSSWNPCYKNPRPPAHPSPPAPNKKQQNEVCRVLGLRVPNCLNPRRQGGPGSRRH